MRRPDLNLGPCHISTYVPGSHGYGQVGWQDDGVREGTTAHRAAWTYFNGPIPDGLTVDHECRIRPCVRREHLRLLTNGANASDNGQVKTNPDTDYICGKGHTMTLGGNGRRYCRTCQNERRRARRAAGKAN